MYIYIFLFCVFIFLVWPHSSDALSVMCLLSVLVGGSVFAFPIRFVLVSWWDVIFGHIQLRGILGFCKDD